MKTDTRGGASAEYTLDERLTASFAAQLRRAERDYPAIASKSPPVPREARAGRSARFRTWPSLVALPVGLVAAAITLLALSPLLLPPASSLPPAHGGIPTEIDGQRVYRAVDRDSFPVSGSFLLGGAVTMPELIPRCPAPPTSGVEDDLIPYCWWVAIDGIRVAPRTASLISDLRDWSIVARVHVNDTQAALCPVSLRDECARAVVVEEVVWQAEPASTPAAPSMSLATSTATPGGPFDSVSLPPPPVSPSDVAVGPDGIPTSIDGQTVYRAGNLPAKLMSYYLGGKLTRDQGCAAPTAPLAKPPACGYWMIDGLRVGTQIEIDEALLDQPIVATIGVSQSLAICHTGTCMETTLVVLWIVWPTAVFGPIE
jgi:hypothetical protein